MIISNDDASFFVDGQQGSILLIDSYIETVIEQPGIYYVKVMAYGVDYVPHNTSYTLNVSLENESVQQQIQE